MLHSSLSQAFVSKVMLVSWWGKSQSLTFEGTPEEEESVGMNVRVTESPWPTHKTDWTARGKRQCENSVIPQSYGVKGMC